MDGLPLSDELRELVTPPGRGGATGPRGGTAPLSDEDVAAALRGLPDWTGDRRSLRRTVVLPPARLDRVLDRIQRIELPPGTQRPRIVRRGDSAEFVLRTASAGAVTALDVELAERLDDIVNAAAAGIPAS
jgi:4a-hydroxytetrahydrobiopterin dehydratase